MISACIIMGTPEVHRESKLRPTNSFGAMPTTVYAAVKVDGFNEQSRIGGEATLPEAGSQDDDRMTPDFVSSGKRHAPVEAARAAVEVVAGSQALAQIISFCSSLMRAA